MQTEQREGPLMMIPTQDYEASSSYSTAASDDSSVSSTIAVACFSQGKHPQLAAPPSSHSHSNKKTVRFNEGDNEVYDNTTVCKEDCRDLWYQAPDYKHFKAVTKYLAREICQWEQLNRSSPYSYHRVLKRTYKACVTCPFETTCVQSVMTATEEKRLREWMQVSTSRLGLERQAIRDIAIDRSFRRQEIVDTVMELQDEVAARQGTAVDAHAQAEIMRRACEEISRTSRLFARCLAQGQTKQQHTCNEAQTTSMHL